jgi:transcription elongation factor Elf1
MGRRKRQKVARRPRKRIPKVFDCPMCGTKSSVVIEIFKPPSLDGIGRAIVTCGNCQLKVELDNVTFLDEPVDVYGHFIDKIYEEQEA